MRPRHSRRTGLSAGTLLLAIGFLYTTPVAGLEYDALRSAAVKRCEAVPASESQSGMVFNPDGYRSYYVRSKCFQDAAVQFRDATLCSQVRERTSLFFSSWAYAPARCRSLVSQGLARDRAAIEGAKNAYARGAMKLRDFRVVRNGNGRDFDILPAFVGDHAASYTLTFEILPPAEAGAPVLLHSSGYHLDADSNLQLYVRQMEIMQRFPAFALGRRYIVRGSVTLEVGNGGQSGYWSPAFIDGVFPARERTSAITIPVVF
jgi:hypothetical protein